MKRREYWRLLRQTMKATGAVRVFRAYFVYFLLSSFLIWLIEPSIPRFRDSLWYCFVLATSVGFGDFTAATTPGRILSAVLSIYSIAAIAIFTAVITGFFMDVIKGNAAQSAVHFLDELEHLPELSKEELAGLSERVKKFRRKT